MISKEEVVKIAKLARLELTEQEIEKMQKDLSAILDYFNLLKKADTSGVETSLNNSMELLSKNSTQNATRRDEVKERRASLAGDLVKVAPQQKDGYIKVKAIL
jgi:aspartyl-tRNA(Asn)/glutamyl-tRNA(Gln) amidotransferase subunit C